MALNIPLPGVMGDTFGKALDSGSLMFQHLMQPRLEREKQAQLERHFQEELKLKKAAAGRAGTNADLNRQLLKEKIRLMNPLEQMKDFVKMQEYIRNGGNPNETPAVNQNPEEYDPDWISRLSSPEDQELPQGQGMMAAPETMPEGMPFPQQQAQVQPGTEHLPHNTGRIDMELMREHPELRAAYKKIFKVDPLANLPQTPEQKQAAALDLFKQKEALKMQNKGGSAPTNAVLTQNQQAIQGIDTVVPMLDELIESKSIPGIFDFSPGKKAAYNAKTSSMIDTLIAAQSLPKVQASIDLVEEQIRRKSGETVTDYKKRLQDLRDDLMKRRGRSQSLLQNRQVNTGEMPAQEKTLNGVKYRKIDGEWHEVE